jgi:hypothetical protein
MRRRPGTGRPDTSSPATAGRPWDICVVASWDRPAVALLGQKGREGRHALDRVLLRAGSLPCRHVGAPARSVTVRRLWCVHVHFGCRLRPNCCLAWFSLEEKYRWPQFLLWKTKSVGGHTTGPTEVSELHAKPFVVWASGFGLNEPEFLYIIGKVLSTSLKYYRSLSLVPHMQNRVFAVSELSIAFF